MSIVNFLYKGTETTIQCQENEKMKEICNKFGNKEKINVNNLYFMYNGNIIDLELKYKEIINEIDKNKNKINILVEEYKKEEVKKNKKISEEIICPECKEKILIKINDYKINLNGCKNGHNFYDILINDFEDKQMIDISKIICEECNINNKSNTYNNEMYKCISCGKILCPLCKLKHDKNHEKINYELKNYICNKHNESFSRYCEQCDNNICIKCEKEHKNHNSISLGEMMPDNNDEKDELKKNIDKLKNEIDDIIMKLNSIKKIIEIYYKITNNIINNMKKINYYKLKNINEIINYNNKINKDIKEIIENKNINEKFKNLMIIYSQMNNKNKNYIIGEIDIKKEDINKDIIIINSYENIKRKKRWRDDKDDYKFENEKEIKDNCIININDKMIPFSYYYKFNKEGKYIIKYSFKNNLSKTDYMFYECNSLTNINLSNFNTENVTNMRSMFYGCKSLTNINLSNFNTQNVTNMSDMFFECKSLTNINLSHFNTQNVKNMNYMFCGCNSLTNIDLSNFNTQNVTNMGNMFRGCNSLTNINLSNFNTENVTNMGYMFHGCNSLTNINLSNFNTKNVTDMSEMFDECSSLTNINLSNFNTQNVTNMIGMFYGCKSLTNIDLSSFNTQNVKEMSSMFRGCKSLTNMNLSNFNTQNVSGMDYMFDGCNSLKKENVITNNIKILNNIY